MVIRSKTLRLVILTSTVLITIIVAIQLVWLQKVYLYEEKQFNINVSKSIKSLYDDMQLVGDVKDNVQKVIENVSPDVYLLRIDCSPNLDQLWVNLKAELTDFDVYTDCRAGRYTFRLYIFFQLHHIQMPGNRCTRQNLSALLLNLSTTDQDWGCNLFLINTHQDSHSQ